MYKAMFWAALSLVLGAVFAVFAFIWTGDGRFIWTSLASGLFAFCAGGVYLDHKEQIRAEGHHHNGVRD